jgi:acyl dehydratase
MASPKLSFQDVNIGDEIPSLSRGPLKRMQQAWMSVALKDPHPLHVDEEFARSVGFPTVALSGAFPCGLLATMFTNWAGIENIKKYSVRLTTIILPGDILTCKGKAVKKWEEDGRGLAECELTVENQRSQLVATGKVVVLLWK